MSKYSGAEHVVSPSGHRVSMFLLEPVLKEGKNYAIVHLTTGTAFRTYSRYVYIHLTKDEIMELLEKSTVPSQSQV